jgi:hypothetical protein
MIKSDGKKGWNTAQIRNLCPAGSVLFVFCYLAAIVVMCSDSVRASGIVYQDDRIRIAVPSDWAVKQLTETTSGDRIASIPIGVVLIKGSFRIYLLTHYSQASGVVGGRFGEISRYVAPWLKDSDPWACFNAFAKATIPVTNQLIRVDLFLDSKPNNKSSDTDCLRLGRYRRVPVWLGSYFGSPSKTGALPGFFLNFPVSKSDSVNTKQQQMVMTAAMDADSPDTLPPKTNESLRRFLNEASALVGSIAYK